MVEMTEAADATVTTTRSTLDAITLRRLAMSEALASGALRVEGDASKLTLLMSMLDPPPELMFEIVTPGDRPQ